MTLELVEPPEPWTTEARHALRKSGFDAEHHSKYEATQAYEQLHREFMRYLRGETDGRSILISGHRGAGKTTVVRKALQDAYRDAARRGNLIPLPIFLHGPTMIDKAFDPRRRKAAASAGGKAEGGKAERNGGEKKPAEAAASVTAAAAMMPSAGSSPGEEYARVKEQALSHIVLCLYRALADAIAEEWMAAVALKQDPARRLIGVELLELGIHLRMELDDAPDPDVLRQIWSYGDNLPGGVSFTTRRHFGFDYPRLLGTPDDQGAREIAALGATATAYRAVMGASYVETLARQIKEELEFKQSKEDKAPAPAAAPSKGGASDAAVTAATGAVGAGAAVVGPWLNNGDWIPGIVGLAVGALSAGFGLNIARSWRRNRQKVTDKSYTITTERDAASLDREVPRLLDRVKRAGFAPIFIIDELDKLNQDADDDIHKFIMYCKHMVTESSIFIFITNRDYFIRLTRGRRRDLGEVTRTYYNNTILISSSTWSLPRYLHSIIRTKGESRELELLKAAWILCVVFRGRMHPFDVNTQLRQLFDSRSEFSTEFQLSAPFLDRMRRNEVTQQLAVLLILEEPDVKARIENDPDFRPFIYDTLYYFARQQWTGEETVSAVTPSLLRKHLLIRAGQALPERDAKGRPDDKSMLDISATDIAFLFRLLKRLVEFLNEPSDLVTAVRQRFGERQGPDPFARSLVDLADVVDPGEPVWQDVTVNG